jgi:hypothetical protein
VLTGIFPEVGGGGGLDMGKGKRAKRVLHKSALPILFLFKHTRKHLILNHSTIATLQGA